MTESAIRSDPRAAQLDARFRNIGFVKAQELLDVYGATPVRPAEEGDRPLTQRQTMMRGVIAHYVLLRRHLPAEAAGDAGPGVIDAAMLNRMLGEVDDA